MALNSSVTSPMTSSDLQTTMSSILLNFTDMVGLQGDPVTGSGGSSIHPRGTDPSSRVLDLSRSYTAVIIILSLLVIITILFTICSLFMKAVAHSRSEDTSAHAGDSFLFMDKGSEFLHDDV